MKADVIIISYLNGRVFLDDFFDTIQLLVRFYFNLN